MRTFYRKNDPADAEKGGGDPKPVVPEIIDPDEIFNNSKVGDFTGPAVPDPNRVEGGEEALSELDAALAKAKPVSKEEPLDEEGKPKPNEKGGDNEEGVLTIEPNQEELEEEVQWTSLATELGIGEIKDNNYDQFVEKFKEFKETLTDPSYVNLEAVKTKFGEEAHNMLVALQEGNTSLFDIASKVQPYYDIVAMDAEEAFTAVYKANGNSEKWINEKIDELKEDGKFDIEVENIKSRAIQLANEKIQESANTLKSFADSTISNKLAADKAEKELIVKEIQQRSEFLGLKLDQKAKDIIAKRVSEGYYSKAVNDAKLKADIILQKEFSQKAIEALQKRNQGAGIKAYQKGLHNLEEVKAQSAKKSGSASGGGSQPEAGSGFGAIRTEGASAVVRV
jgi:hypothetical protein